MSGPDPADVPVPAEMYEGMKWHQKLACVEAERIWRAYREGDSSAVAERDGGYPRIDLPTPGSLAVGWVRPVSYEELWAADPPEGMGGPQARGPAPTVFGRRGHDVPGTCGAPIQRGYFAGKRCPQTAGQGTYHVGAGRCLIHGGARGIGRPLGAWLMAHAFGQELGITPWEALLKAVRIAAGKVVYVEWVLSQAQSDLELEGRFGRTEDGILLHPDTGEPLGAGQFRDLSFWVRQSELWHDRMAKTAKMAIDAGVAKWQIEQAEHQAATLARVLNEVVEGLESAGDVPEALISQVRAHMRRALLALDEDQSRRSLPVGGPDEGAVDSTYRETP